jgi:hypothetical protein
VFDGPMRSDPAMIPPLRIRVLVGAILVLGLLAAPPALLAQGGASAPSAAGAQATAPMAPTTPTAPATTPTAPATTPTAPATTPTAPAPPPSPCTVTTLRLRCPDLIMSAPSELHLDRTTTSGRVLLRATSAINNRGSGPLELRAHRTGSHLAVYQAIYDRSDRVHLYPTAARLVFKYIPGERYEYGNVGAASYWKLEHAAAFELWSIDARRRPVRVVRTGPKVDYCLRDLVRTHPTSASPRAPVYPGCNQEPRMQSDVLGTSVGWADVYPYMYPEQWIDVTGLRGRFAYVQIVDPDNLLAESNHLNDLSETYVELPSGRVLGYRVGVTNP